MKNVFAVVALFVLTSAQVQAQDFGFGLKGGLNLANLNVSDPAGTYESRTGYHAGVFLRGKFNKIAIQPELLLSTQGAEVSHIGLGNFNESFTYLNVPVLLKFYMISGLNVHVGPQFGFLLDADATYDSGLGPVPDFSKDNYKKSDVSASIGAGFDFPFGLTTDVRYNIGVKDINDKANGSEVKNEVFMVSIGWNFLK